MLKNRNEEVGKHFFHTAVNTITGDGSYMTQTVPLTQENDVNCQTKQFIRQLTHTKIRLNSIRRRSNTVPIKS